MPVENPTINARPSTTTISQTATMTHHYPSYHETKPDVERAACGPTVAEIWPFELLLQNGIISGRYTAPFKLHRSSKTKSVTAPMFSLDPQTRRYGGVSLRTSTIEQSSVLQWGQQRPVILGPVDCRISFRKQQPQHLQPTTLHKPCPRHNMQHSRYSKPHKGAPKTLGGVSYTDIPGGLFSPDF